MAQTFVRRKYDPSAKEFLEYLCRHPHGNLPVIVEVTEDSYVMEYVAGRTLTQVLEEQCLARWEAKSWILQLLDAVEVLHRFHIVHRDIKPDNIVLGEDGVLRLIDFDIARKFVTGKTRDTQYLGTTGFAAPEQYGFTQTDARTDIYAIGVVYNMMLKRKHPAERLASGELGRIIRKCTEIDMEKRYRNIRQLRSDIIGERFLSYGIFDHIPGFRSRNLLKMILSSVFYLFGLLGFADLLIAMGEMDVLADFSKAVILLTMLVYIILFYAIVLGSRIVLATPLPIKRFCLKKTVLAVLWFLLGSVVIWLSGSENFRYALTVNPVLYPFYFAGEFVASHFLGYTFS